MSAADEVDAAVKAALPAFKEWRNTPVTDRIKPLFKFKGLLEKHQDEIARTITNEAGKTYGESIAEVARGVENVEVACGAPILMQGDQQRGHRPWHRRAHDPSAARRRGRHHAVQLPRHGPALVPAVRCCRR